MLKPTHTNAVAVAIKLTHTKAVAIKGVGSAAMVGNFMNLYFIVKLLYMIWNFYRKLLNVLLKNLMHMVHSEIFILKFI